jgi:hypothetical protein
MHYVYELFATVAALYVVYPVLPYPCYLGIRSQEMLSLLRPVEVE